MKCNCSCKCKGSHILMLFSVVALILSALVSLFEMELWLAGTQWILVSIVLAVYALTMSVHGDCGCGDEGTCGCKDESANKREDE